MSSTITLQTVINLAAAFTELIPLVGVGGYTNEPALSIANDTIQELLGEKFPWKFNRKDMPLLFTTRGKQDYLFAGASAFVLTDAKGVGIELSANNGISVAAGVVTVRTLEAHRFVVGDVVYLNNVVMSPGTAANYNSVFTDNGSSSAWTGGYTVTSVPTSTTFTFAAVAGQNNSDVGGAGTGITDFGWAEGATMVSPADGGSPQGVQYVSAVRKLQPSGYVFNPSKVCVLSDLGTGVLKVRFFPLPGQSWAVTIGYQAKAPLFTGLSQTWSPFPDEFSYVYRQMFLAQAFRFANSARSEIEYQKAQANIAKALGQDDREDSDEFIVPASPIGDSTFSGIITEFQ